MTTEESITMGHDQNLFWQDGSLLLAKYIEHQRELWLGHHLCEPGFDRPNLRILELGCGTGLAGISAALSLGRSSSGVQNEKNQKEISRGGSLSNEDLEGGKGGGVEVQVFLTDLPYALSNARQNVRRNSASLEATRAEVLVSKLDWTCPVPQEIMGEHSFERDIYPISASQRT